MDAEFVLCAPDLIGPEVANTIWKKVRRGEISEGEAGEILDAFHDLPIEILPTKALLPAAFRIAVTLDRKFHSAVLTSKALAAHMRWMEDEL